MSLLEDSQVSEVEANLNAVVVGEVDLVSASQKRVVLKVEEAGVGVGVIVKLDGPVELMLGVKFEIRVDSRRVAIGSEPKSTFLQSDELSRFMLEHYCRGRPKISLMYSKGVSGRASCTSSR